MVYRSDPVPIPKRDHGISIRTSKGHKYVYFSCDVRQDPVTKKWITQSRMIGKLNPQDPTTMFPNRNFPVFFPEEAEEAQAEREAPEGLSAEEDSDRCTFVYQEWVVKVGLYVVIRKLAEQLGLTELLEHAVGSSYTLLLDLIACRILHEDSAGWQYPAYAKEHALFSPGMQVAPDSVISEFLQSITEETADGFLDEWITAQKHSRKACISYGLTDKNFQAGDVELTDCGAAEDDLCRSVSDYAVAYDLVHGKPLLYEYYPGGINGVSQVKTIAEKLSHYGYRTLVCFLDRGRITTQEIRWMDRMRYEFLIMAKGRCALIHDRISQVRGTFETDTSRYISPYRVYGTTVTGRLFSWDPRKRYFHIFFSISDACREKQILHAEIEDIRIWLKKQIGRKCTLTEGMKKYFRTEAEDGKLVSFECDSDSIRDELEHCGYFAIITSEKMTAADALNLCRSHEENGTLFRTAAGWPGSCSGRPHPFVPGRVQVFTSFAALILKNEMYLKLKRKADRLGGDLEHMTVRGAAELLDSIKIVRTENWTYQMADRITKKQKEILSAFFITPDALEESAMAIGAELRAQAKEDP